MRQDPFPSPLLRGVEAKDSPFLYHIASHYPETWPRVCLAGAPTPQEFEFKLWDGVLAQYLVTVQVDAKEASIGLVSLYLPDFLSGFAWVESVGLPGDHHEHVRDDALAMLIDRAFQSWTFRKVQGVHHSFQAPVFSGLSSVKASEEVRLADVYRHDGMFWDRVISTISRDDWCSADEVAR